MTAHTNHGPTLCRTTYRGWAITVHAAGPNARHVHVEQAEIPAGALGELFGTLHQDTTARTVTIDLYDGATLEHIAAADNWAQLVTETPEPAGLPWTYDDNTHRHMVIGRRIHPDTEARMFAEITQHIAPIATLDAHRARNTSETIAA